MKLGHSIFLFAAATASCLSAPAYAAVTVDVLQVGSDVVVTSSGTFDPTGLTPAGSLAGFLVGGTSHPYQSVYASAGFLGLGSDASLGGYSGLTGPSQFGSGGVFEASSTSGAGFIINASLFGGSPTIYISTIVVNGTPISETSATATFLGQSFASLGLTPGQYVFSAPNDSVTLNIGQVAAAIPEPATWSMLLFGFGGIAISIRRGRRTFPKSPAPLPDRSTKWRSG